MTRNLRIIIIMTAAILLLIAAIAALSCDGCSKDPLLSPSDIPEVSISDSHPVQMGTGMVIQVCLDFPADSEKKIGILQIPVM